MTSLRKLLILIAVLALIVIVAYVDYRRSSHTESLVKVGEVNRVEMLFHGTRAMLARHDKTWQLREFAGQAPADTRANADLVNHVLDLVRVLSDETKSSLDPKDAKDYGMNEPELALTLGWDSPKPGEEVVIFGHRDLSGHRSFAFFPKRPLLLEVPSSAVAVLEGKGPLDLRDRHVTTFEPDDIEDLSMAGKCGSFWLTRDGDRWTSHERVLEPAVVDQWLGRLLGTFYDELDEHPDTATDGETNPVCKITLKGIRDRSETVEIFKAKGTLWATSTALPARYHLPQGFMETLVPPSH